MNDKERKKIEKEIMGLTAKLNWDHAPETSKAEWRVRIEELKQRLKPLGD